MSMSPYRARAAATMAVHQVAVVDDSAKCQQPKRQALGVCRATLSQLGGVACLPSTTLGVCGTVMTGT